MIDKSVKYTRESSYQEVIPQWIIDKWQKIINILAEMLGIPAALIMKVDKSFMEVYLASHSKDNPYFPGARDRMDGLYCETVINSQKKLLVPDALADPQWDSNPDIKLGMISYLGFPINYPNHQPFGTICVLDNKANGYSPTFEHLMLQFKDVIELDLKMFKEYQKQTVMFSKSVPHQINSISQALEQVLLKERLLVKIINSLPNIFICLIDKEMKIDFSAGYSFLEASKVKGSLVGYSIREVFGKAASNLRNCLLRVASGNSTFFETNYNNQFHHFLIMPFPTSVEPISQYLVVVEDVTDQRNLEISVLDRENKLKEAQKIAHLGHWELNLKLNELTWSDEVYRIFGMEPQQTKATYEEFMSYIYPEDWEKVNAAYTTSIATKRPYNIIHRIQLKSGEIKYVNEKCVTEYDTQGNPICSIGTVLDITDRMIAEKVIQKKNKELKQLNEEYRTAKEKAEESDRLKTRFLQNVSHEIRTPLNGIQGFSEILADNTLTDDARKFYADIVGDSCQQLVHIMEDIIEISKLETQKSFAMKKRVNTNDIMQDLFASYNFIASQKKIQLKFKPGLTDLQSIIHTDGYVLHRVLSILIENALKYTFEGHVEIGYTLQDNNKIEFYVKDTGIGISAEDQRNIFERFYNVGDNPKHGGLGVGLAIAKENLKLLGGDVRVESKEGLYSHFYVAIPYTPMPSDDVSIKNES
ncbi:MAG: PAS domain-containing protein [Marinilabiliaceae bacterium]|nr:PAS domain-containing protein [Marinilabiliaceae bacterium]